MHPSTQFNDENIQALFGIEDAENENPERLKEYFFRNKAFENLVVGLPIRVLVGHKGVGKSALLKVAYMEDQTNNQLSVWVQPNDLRQIASGNNTEINSLIQEWKEGINFVILKKITESYLSDSTILDKLKVAPTIDYLISTTQDILSAQTNSWKNATTKNTVERFLKNHDIVVYIDDLDRGWEARGKDIKRISALLNAIRDLVGHHRNVKFRLGLRSDVYFLVRTSDESTDKIEQNIIWLTWNNHEILSVIAKRIETFFGRTVDEEALLKTRQNILARYLDSVAEPRFQGMGKWENAPTHRVLLSLTRKRPRDLVKLLSAAAREAYRNSRNVIGTMDLRNTFEAYSSERLQDIINEFRSELPDITNLLYGMRPTTKEKKTSDSYLYSNDQIVNKLRNLKLQNSFRFTNGNPVTPLSLAEFLYKIDFITARRNDGDFVIRKFFDQSRHLQNQFVDFGFHWEVHPAYRWALQPGEPDSIFRQLDLEMGANT